MVAEMSARTESAGGTELTIGEVARQMGIAPSAIRWYRNQPESPRFQSGDAWPLPSPR